MVLFGTDARIQQGIAAQENEEQTNQQETIVQAEEAEDKHEAHDNNSKVEGNACAVVGSDSLLQKDAVQGIGMEAQEVCVDFQRQETTLLVVDKFSAETQMMQKFCCRRREDRTETLMIDGTGSTQSDEEDEEDIDFNPLSQHSASPEASSGLSSESEDLVEENLVVAEGTCDGKGFDDSEAGSEDDNAYTLNEEEHEVNDGDMDLNRGEGCILQEEGHLKYSYGKSAMFEADSASQRFCSVMDAANDIRATDKHPGAGYNETMPRRTEEEVVGYTFATLSDLRSPLRKEVKSQSYFCSEEEQAVDAICKRTRAHYSLADMSLDELETFLQESDEEDYFQNVDDEEEYRKFVAAVQGKWNAGTEPNDENGEKGDEEDDEEDDYDFEIELEEALESDYEEMPKGDSDSARRTSRGVGRKMDMREKRRHKTRPQVKERLLGLAKARLRPLRPSFSAGDCDTEPKCKPTASGFIASQIGQLYCLIHEHVQLLVQVLSLCILEPSRQQIAMDTHRLLSQLVETCDRVRSWKKSAYPESYFCVPYVHSSIFQVPFSHYVQHLYPKLEDKAADAMLKENIMNNFSQPSINAASSSLENGTPGVLNAPACSVTNSNFEGRASCETSVATASSDRLPTNPVSSVKDQGTCVDTNFCWAPSISGPVYSLLDVAPLALVKEFLADIPKVVERYRQQHLECGTPHDVSREPLFPLQVDANNYKGHFPDNLPSRKMTFYDNIQTKKTMAAVLVENTKKQSIALVPKEISALISRFVPCFNPALFPHKAPPSAVANRLLFTDAEDELLAMGLMTYNTNWDAIQEHFLPSKTAHQIFVRQKNRSAARAPENSIKAVRRLKTSPLTKEEVLCIQEGLKVFKNDWTKVWKQCVPYRDPVTLPRQWRVATGLQKSYKTTREAKQIPKAKKQEKGVLGTIFCDGGGDNGELNSEGEADGANNVYLHEAFLKDSKTDCSTFKATPVTGHTSKLPSVYTNTLPTSCHGTSSQINTGGTTSINHMVPCAQSHLPPERSSASGVNVFESSHNVRLSKSKRKRYQSWSCGLYKNGTQTIKLAPGLPSLNLPPSVRVISQSKLSSDHPLSQHQKGSMMTLMNCTGNFHVSRDLSSKVYFPSHVYQPGNSQAAQKDQLSEKPVTSVAKSACASMHPLLMQGAAGGVLSYLQISDNTYCSYMSKYLGQPQQVCHLSVEGSGVSSCTRKDQTKSSVELHPFLQDHDEQLDNQIRSARPSARERNPSALTTGNQVKLDQGIVQWPSALSNPMSQPGSLRASQQRQKQRRILQILHNGLEKDSPMLSSAPVAKNTRKKPLNTNLVNGNQKGKGKVDQQGSGGDESSMNIVMEHEELTDSEEEIERGVQFEYEEMGDSEKEGSDDEEHTHELDKVEGDIEFEEEEIGSDDSCG